MTKRIACMTIFIGLVASVAHANHIESWGQGSAGVDYAIDQFLGTVEILHGNGLEYKFYAETSEGSGVPGVINNITVAAGATGDFELLIDHPTSGKAGAAHWKAATLWREGDSDTWTLLGADISGNLCADGLGTPGNIRCEDITGDITAETLVGNLTTDTMRNLTITGNGPHDGDITVWLPYPHAFQESIVIGDANDPQAVMNGKIYIQGRWYTCDGNITINGDMYGGIQIDDECRGRIHIKGDFGEKMWIGYLGDEGQPFYCEQGWIEIDGDMLDPSDPGDPLTLTRITVGWPNRDSWGGGIHVHGDMGGKIVFGDITQNDGTMQGTRIYIDGQLKNNVDPSAGAEIEVREIGYREDPYGYDNYGAVVVNADGFNPYPGPAGNWESGAVVKVGVNSYSGHTPGAHVLNVVETCVGDVNYDGVFDGADWTDYGLVPHIYDTTFPGLAPSRVYHSDGNGDGVWDPYNTGGQWYPYDSDDAPYLDAALTASCCLAVVPDHLCLGDIVLSGDVNLADLSMLLANYGMTSGATHGDGDLDADEDVDLSDLAILLAVYGEICDCPGGGAAPMSGGGGGESIGTTTVSWLSRSTLSTTSDVFSFDLNVQLDDAANAWTASGVALTTHNGAAFVLAASPTTQNAAATFVCSPGALTAASPASVEIAGSHSPLDAIEVFETDEINVVWYDRDASTPGSGAVMRLVLDTSGVTSGAAEVDVSGVYFSQSGPMRQGDILIANVTLEAGTMLGGASTAALDGAFYATPD